MKTFSVKLPVFEGPFDLLLFLIEQHEIDIHDIPIAEITDHFFNYLQKHPMLPLETAGDFLRVAATLMYIKATILLPTSEARDEEIEEARETLRSNLLLYQTFKEAAEQLAALFDLRSKQYRRGNSPDLFSSLEEQYTAERSLKDVSLYHLLHAYQRLWKRYTSTNKEKSHAISLFPYTVVQQKQTILQKLSMQSSFHFMELVEKVEQQHMYMIINFLALLELWQSKEITIEGGGQPNEFWIKPIK